MHPEILRPVTTVPIAKCLTSADGTAIYAEAVGDPTNPHIVFLHGFWLASVVWDCIFHNPRYADQFYLVRYDMRGHGRTGKPTIAEAYSSERYAEDFLAVVKTFDARIHYRLAVKEVGRPLESYRDPQELVWVVYCALLGTTTGLLDELHADANPS